MRYRMELCRDGAYLIGNWYDRSITEWSDLISPKNNQRPIRIRSLPIASGFPETKGNLDDFVSSLADDGFNDPERKIYFRTRDEYLAALHGESKAWIPVGIDIDDVGAAIAFSYKGGAGHDVLNVSPIEGRRFKLLIEIDHPDEETEKYILYLEKDFITVTEFWPWGIREIYFKYFKNIPKHPDENYFYAEVIEHRK